MKFNITLVLLTFLYSCIINNDTTFSEREFYKNTRNKPNTQKEKKYINKLKLNGYSNINIQSPRIGLELSGNSTYHISLNSNLEYNNENFDSITKINYEIAKELYNNVIEDSILFDISNIYVTLLVKSSFNNSEKIIFKSISKKQLENDLNYKIIKKEKVKYEKVTLH
jgi:hypothetical protein